MLDFDSEDINGMDNDAGEEQDPPPTGHWTTTSSYDIYMVDTPKENNDEERKDAAKDNPLEKQPKRRRRRRFKSRVGKNSDNSTGKNETSVDSKAIEQDEPADGEHSTEPLSDHGDAEGKAHQPISERRTVTPKFLFGFYKRFLFDLRGVI